MDEAWDGIGEVFDAPGQFAQGTGDGLIGSGESIIDAISDPGAALNGAWEGFNEELDAITDAWEKSGPIGVGSELAGTVLSPISRIIESDNPAYTAGEVLGPVIIIGETLRIVKKILPRIRRPRKPNGSGGGGRGGNKLRPHPDAEGPHTTLRFDDDGNVKRYETWDPNTNPRNPRDWDSRKRFDRDGKEHYNKETEEWIRTPHVHDPKTPGKIRKPRSNEFPCGSTK